MLEAPSPLVRRDFHSALPALHINRLSR
jgi:hypothetical protein